MTNLRVLERQVHEYVVGHRKWDQEVRQQRERIEMHEVGLVEREYLPRQPIATQEAEGVRGEKVDGSEGDEDVEDEAAGLVTGEKLKEQGQGDDGSHDVSKAGRIGEGGAGVPPEVLEDEESA